MKRLRFPQYQLEQHRVRSLSAFALLALAYVSTARATTLTFQNGASGYSGAVDTYIRQASPTSSFSTSTAVEWDGDDPSGTNQANVALIRFDAIFGAGVSQIPVGSQIASATLTYTVGNTGAVGQVYESMIPWAGTTTWNTFGAAPGVDPGDYGSYVTSASGSALGFVVIDVTPSLILWSATPASNRGWIILPTGTDGVQIRSSEYTVISSRPKLTVTFGVTIPPALVRAPYLQTGTPTSMTLRWRTNVPTDSVVHWGVDPAVLSSVATDSILKTDHAVTLTGLASNSKFFYDVGLTNQILAGGDANHFFQTSPAPGTLKPFTFWVAGDTGNGSIEQQEVRDAMLSATAADPPDFWLHMGDIAYTSGTDAEFTNHHFAVYQSILRNTVSWPTLGNHEGTLSDSQTQTGPYYTAFTLPKLGEAGGMPSNTEAYYSFDYANAHFICLDSHDSPRVPGSAMLTWLANDLAMTTQRWIIAFWHHPPYTHGSHDSDDPFDSDGRMVEMRENVLPILEAGGVDLVLGGHSHIYERSYLVDGAYDTPTTALGHIVDPGDGRLGGSGAYLKPVRHTAHGGAVYVVAGHGGQTVSGIGDHPLMYFSEIENGSCLVTVDGNRLSLLNLRRDSVISDYFSLIKTPTGDVNADGVIDDQDVWCFVNVLMGWDRDQQHVELADLSKDDTVNAEDIAKFVTAYLANEQ